MPEESVERQFSQACEGIRSVLQMKEVDSVFLDGWIAKLKPEEYAAEVQFVRNILERRLNDLTISINQFVRAAQAIQDFISDRLEAQHKLEQSRNEMFWDFLEELGPVIESHELHESVLPPVSRLLQRLKETVKADIDLSPNNRSDRLRRLFGGD
jgi:DNA anti-recombination protein RmuC